MKLLLVLLICGIASQARADSRGDAAAAFLDSVASGKGTPKLPAGKPIKLVLDSGTQFAANSPCAKLKIGTIANDTELAAFATCVQAAIQKLGLGKQPMPKAADLTRTAGATYLRGWFAKPFHPSLVIPSGQQLIGTSINRPTDSEGSGVAVMIYMLVDATDRVTAVYAYAGHWAYPI